MASEPYWVKTDDWHTAGEPFRIVPELPKDCFPEGATVAERRRNVIAQQNHPLDVLRQTLCREPRGHADMYGGFIVPPDDAGAHFGVMFWHKDGFSTACGHGTIALGAWAVATGRAPASPDGVTKVVIDVPSGRVAAEVMMEGGKVKHIDFVNVPSYQFAADVPVSLPSLGIEVNADLGWGGAAYAYVNTLDIDNDLHVEPARHDDFVRLGREIKAQLGERGHHKGHELYGTCFYEDLGKDAANPGQVRQRNVVVFADGQIDRSPCGSGTAARVGILLARNKLGEADGSSFAHSSIVDTVFKATVDSKAEGFDKFPGCIPRIRGNANLVGRCEFYIDREDPTFPGFVFR